jgi:hypothetical protein
VRWWPASIKMRLVFFGAPVLLLLRLLLWSSRAAQVDISISLDGVLVPVSSPRAGRGDTVAAQRACAGIGAGCERMVLARIEDVRRVQTEQIRGAGAWRLALGTVSHARIRTLSGSFPIVIKPADGPHVALREWSLVYGTQFIDNDHLLDLSNNEIAIKQSLRLLDSATVEVSWVILPAVCLGLACGFVLKLSSEVIPAMAVVGSPSRSPDDDASDDSDSDGTSAKSSTVDLDCFFLKHQSGFERIKFGLAVLVVLGHSCELTDSMPDMCGRLFGVPLSTLACTCMFFLSGISSASALRQPKRGQRRMKNTSLNVFTGFLLPRVRRLWAYSFLTLVGVSVLRGGQAPSAAVLLQLCVGNFIEWNAAPPTFIHSMQFSNTDMLPCAASMWTVGLTIMCWTLSAAMHGAGSVAACLVPSSSSSSRAPSLLSTVPLICVLSSLLSTGCNSHISSFFFGCLLVAIVRDYRITENTVRTRALHVAVVCATVPWGSIILGQTPRVKSCLLPLFLCLLRAGAAPTPWPPRRIFTRYFRGTIVGLFCFSSAIQRWAIDTFPEHFDGSPWRVFAFAVVGSLCAARGCIIMFRLI